ncbi:hypothetical protein Bhyg_05310 [Pseudolycoriella hygida]|uniref:Uncharacterized protein n=1 Tax=Pseudolycoriella hygida TaxID=35572 RepID=A0A9Q0NHD7_9DIPT|nr:hypothetical protein Bhyg_05310 [Pseudolycoriella hygida]
MFWVHTEQANKHQTGTALHSTAKIQWSKQQDDKSTAYINLPKPVRNSNGSHINGH